MSGRFVRSSKYREFFPICPHCHPAADNCRTRLWAADQKGVLHRCSHVMALTYLPRINAMITFESQTMPGILILSRFVSPPTPDLDSSIPNSLGQPSLPLCELGSRWWRCFRSYPTERTRQISRENTPVSGSHGGRLGHGLVSLLVASNT